MKTHRMLMIAAVLTVVLAFGAESFARGGGSGGGMGGGQGSQYRGQSASQSTNQVRPEGSQRRDGTFLQTGTTASGATSRPGKGRGVMDGTGVNAAAPTVPAPPSVQ